MVHERAGVKQGSCLMNPSEPMLRDFSWISHINRIRMNNSNKRAGWDGWQTRQLEGGMQNGKVKLYILSDLKGS